MIDRYTPLFNIDDELEYYEQDCINCVHYDMEGEFCHLYSEAIAEHGEIVNAWIQNPGMENDCLFFDELEIEIFGDDLDDEYIWSDLEVYNLGETEVRKKPKGTGAQYKKVVTVKTDPKTKKKTRVVKWIKKGGAKKAKDKARARKAVKTKKKDIRGQKLAKKKRKKTLKVKKQFGIK